MWNARGKPLYATEHRQDIQIRLLDERDSVADLTDLLHRAYKPLADAGMNYFATHQTEEQTRERIRNGKCYVALIDTRIVGTLTYYFPLSPRKRTCDSYRRAGVALFGQFAVEPRLQGQGIGGRMLEIVEEATLKEGATELAFDTAEHAARLVDYYSKFGFRIVDAIDHRPVTNYKSVVMSKSLSR